MDRRDRTGWTALHHAACKNNSKAVMLLLQNGSSLNARTYENSTPLHVAAYNGRVGIVRLLIEAGACVELRDHLGDTARMVAEKLKRFAVLEEMNRFSKIDDVVASIAIV